MNDDQIETIRAMRIATDEIQRLRHQNEILSAKVDVMELFGLVFRTQPAWLSQGMGEDPVWLMQKVIEKIEKAEIAADLKTS